MRVANSASDVLTSTNYKISTNAVCPRAVKISTGTQTGQQNKNLSSINMFW